MSSEATEGTPAPKAPDTELVKSKKEAILKAARKQMRDYKMVPKMAVSLAVPQTIWEQFSRTTKINGGDPYEHATALLATGMKIQIETTLAALKKEEEERLASLATPAGETSNGG